MASDACVADHVPRTAQGALDSAEAAAPEPLLLPPHVKYSLPLVVRLYVHVCIVGRCGRAPSKQQHHRITTPPPQHRKLLRAPEARATQATDDEYDDEPYPELPTVNLLAYDLFLYCAPPPPSAQPQEQQSQEGPSSLWREEG